LRLRVGRLLRLVPAGEALSLRRLRGCNLEGYGLRGCVRWLRPEVQSALLGIRNTISVLVDEQVDRHEGIPVPHAPGITVRVPLRSR
jgi:hypothetical protein